jgi:hypothetical protein
MVASFLEWFKPWAYAERAHSAGQSVCLRPIAAIAGIDQAIVNHAPRRPTQVDPQTGTDADTTAETEEAHA